LAAVQAKLVVGAVDDPLEREADALADRVMREPSARAGVGPATASTTARIQRSCAACEAEEETIRRVARRDGGSQADAMESAQAPLRRQPGSGTLGEPMRAFARSGSLRIGGVHDLLEREADRVADRIIATRPVIPTVSRASFFGVQRACSACEEREDEEVRRKAVTGGAPSLSAAVAGDIHRLQRGGGQPLPPGTREFMEPRFGADLGGVRVHHHSDSHRLNEQLGARAFTLGNDIFFGHGQYQPETTAGRRLLAHELTHTLQQRGRNAPIVRRLAQEPMSSTEDTAEAVAEDVELGTIATSYDFEERVRALSRSERRHLRSLLSGRSWADQDVIDELLVVLDNVQEGHVGATAGGPAPVPCKPGDVDPVSAEEWEEDPHLVEIQLGVRDGEARGKLGGHTPPETVALFRRALVQWGCELASPARNPLPMPGGYDKGFRSAVRQFQRAEGLTVDGAAGPMVVGRMASRLHNVQVRHDVEREQAGAELAEQKAADDAVAAREGRIQRLIATLLAESERYAKDRSDRYGSIVAPLIAQRIVGYGAELISEGLERISLQDPDIYHHILFGGKLIIALQKLGVHGLRFATPRGADFLDGFIIESNEREAEPAGASTEFSGWDFPELALGFNVGTVSGIAGAVIDNFKGLAALFTPEFWTAMREMVPRLLTEPEYRYLLGRAAAEALHKRIAGLDAADPYDYGEQLGTLFGMLVFEIAAGLLLTGGALVVLRGLDRAKAIADLPRLGALARKVASSSLVRAGARVVGKARAVAEALATRVDDLVARAEKLLPELSQRSRAARQVAELEAAERAIDRHLRALRMSNTKLELARELADPDPGLVQRLADDVGHDADALEDALDTAGPVRHADDLEGGRAIQDVADLPPEVFAAELRYVESATPSPVSRTIGETHYDLEVALPNGHTYRRDSAADTWCRFSYRKKKNCGIPVARSGPSSSPGKASSGRAATAPFPRSTLRGVSLAWLKRNRPEGWRQVTSDNRGGWKWLDENNVERLRFQRPTRENASNAQWARMAQGYFRWQNELGEHLDINGKVVPHALLLADKDAYMWQTHIPYEGH